MTFTLKEAQELVEMFGGDEETAITVVESEKGHSGKGKYAYFTDYPSEGTIFLA